jgi:hypothetical protein
LIFERIGFDAGDTFLARQALAPEHLSHAAIAVADLPFHHL